MAATGEGAVGLLEQAAAIARLQQDINESVSMIQSSLRTVMDWKSPEMFVCLKFRLDALVQESLYMHLDTEGLLHQLLVDLKGACATTLQQLAAHEQHALRISFPFRRLRQQRLAARCQVLLSELDRKVQSTYDVVCNLLVPLEGLRSTRLKEMQTQAQVLCALEEEYVRVVTPAVEDLERKHALLGPHFAVLMYLNDSWRPKAEAHRLKLRGFWTKLEALVAQQRGFPAEDVFTPLWLHRGSQCRLLGEPLEAAAWYCDNRHIEVGRHYVDGLTGDSSAVSEYREVPPLPFDTQSIASINSVTSASISGLPTGARFEVRSNGIRPSCYVQIQQQELQAAGHQRHKVLSSLLVARGLKALGRGHQGVRFDETGSWPQEASQLLQQKPAQAALQALVQIMLANDSFRLRSSSEMEAFRAELALYRAEALNRRSSKTELKKSLKGYAVDMVSTVEREIRTYLEGDPEAGEVLRSMRVPLVKRSQGGSATGNDSTGAWSVGESDGLSTTTTVGPGA